MSDPIQSDESIIAGYVRAGRELLAKAAAASRDATGDLAARQAQHRAVYEQIAVHMESELAALEAAAAGPAKAVPERTESTVKAEAHARESIARRLRSEGVAGLVGADDLSPGERAALREQLPSVLRGQDAVTRLAASRWESKHWPRTEPSNLLLGIKAALGRYILEARTQAQRTPLR